MNIANIFGLHMGCRIKHSFMCDNRLHEGTSLLTGVEILQGGTILLEAGFFKEYNYEYCKIILKPLSKITDEDKAEFMEKFYPADSIFWRYMRIVSFQASGLDVYSTRYNQEGECPYCQLVTYTYQQALFLSTKGYKIEGIVSDEYCEVEE